MSKNKECPLCLTPDPDTDNIGARCMNPQCAFCGIWVCKDKWNTRPEPPMAPGFVTGMNGSLIHVNDSDGPSVLATPKGASVLLSKEAGKLLLSASAWKSLGIWLERMRKNEEWSQGEVVAHYVKKAPGASKKEIRDPEFRPPEPPKSG